MVRKSNVPEAIQGGEQNSLSLELQQLFLEKVEEWFDDYCETNAEAVKFHFKNDFQEFKRFALRQLQLFVQAQAGLTPNDALAKLEGKLNETMGTKVVKVKPDLLAEDSKGSPGSPTTTRFN